MAVWKCDNYIHGFKIVFCILIMGVVFFTCEEVEAVRVLEGEKWLQRNLVIQTLPRGPVRPSGPNPCSNIPGGRGRGRCTLAENDVNFGGHLVARAPAASPQMNVVDFAGNKTAASSEETNDYQKQESSS